MTGARRDTGACAPTNRTEEFLPRGAFWIRDQATAVGQPPLHRHEYFQIHVNLSGTTEHALGATTHAIGPGTVSFVLPLRVHRIRHVEPSQFFVINYRLGFLRPESRVEAPELEELPYLAMPELAPFLFQEHVGYVLEDADLQEASALCRRMQTEHVGASFYAHEFIRADLFRLIGLVCRKYDDQFQALARANKLQGSRRASLARVSRYIREHLTQPITLADAAAAAFLSPSYLAYLLKRETGRTLVEIVTTQRVDLACRMLLTSARPIGEIAASVGFEDEAYFSRRFRQLRGCSPRAYRDAKDGAPLPRGAA